MKNALVIMLVCILCSCERVFPNDDLDYMWHLDNVEYTDSHQCQTDSCWMSVARHMAVFEGNTSQGYAQTFAMLRDSSDSLFFDFSMCSDTALTMEIIGNFGMNSLRSVYSYHFPKRNRLVLSGRDVVLYFIRW